MVKCVSPRAMKPAELFLTIRRAALPVKIPHYSGIEGGDMTGPRFAFCVPSDGDYHAIFEKAGYTVERIKTVSEADIGKINNGNDVDYEVVYHQCDFLIVERS